MPRETVDRVTVVVDVLVSVPLTEAEEGLPKPSLDVLVLEDPSGPVDGLDEVFVQLVAWPVRGVLVRIAVRKTRIIPGRKILIIFDPVRL